MAQQQEGIQFADSSDSDNSESEQSVGLNGGDVMKCQICGMWAEIGDFGGIACRTCAAFFRSLMNYCYLLQMSHPINRQFPISCQ